MEEERDVGKWRLDRSVGGGSVNMTTIATTITIWVRVRVRVRTIREMHRTYTEHLAGTMVIHRRDVQWKARCAHQMGLIEYKARNHG